MITQRLESFARRHQVRCTADITAASPPTYNDPQLLSSVLPKLKAQFSGQVVTENYRGMFAENFSYYTAHVSCLYFGLGIQKEQLGTQSLHTPPVHHPPRCPGLWRGVVLLVGGQPINNITFSNEKNC